MTNPDDKQEGVCKELFIDPDWGYSFSMSAGVGSYHFLPTDRCRGYNLVISKWRLRLVEESQSAIKEINSDLLKKAGDEVVRVVGKDAFVKSNKASADLNITMLRGPSMLMPDHLRAAWHQRQIQRFQTEYAQAYMLDMYSSRIRNIALPLYTLAYEKGLLYRCDQEPWPTDDPPTRIVGLTESGIYTKFNWGLLAYPNSGKDIWIVSTFHRTKVGYKAPRNNTTQKTPHTKAPEVSDELSEIRDVKKMISMMLPHTMSIPIMLADYKQAQLLPETAALELHNRVGNILSPTEIEIWRTIRACGGLQIKALPLLKKIGINSAATLSRRVKIIDTKLSRANPPISPCSSPAPPMRYSAHSDEKSGQDDLTACTTDWTKDPIGREITIKNYLIATPEEREYFQKYYPDIDNEASEHKRCRK